MKFNVFDRIVLAVLLLVVIALAAGCLGLALHLIPQESVEVLISAIYSYYVNSIILGAAGIVLLALALKLMVGKHAPPAPPAPQSALVKEGELGCVFVSLAALDSMVQKHCRANNRIRECESHITTSAGGVAIKLRLFLMPDTAIPDLSAELQASLKAYVESLSGIMVTEVVILVASTASAQPKSRVD